MKGASATYVASTVEFGVSCSGAARGRRSAGTSRAAPPTAGVGGDRRRAPALGQFLEARLEQLRVGRETLFRQARRRAGVATVVPTQRELRKGGLGCQIGRQADQSVAHAGAPVRSLLHGTFDDVQSPGVAQLVGHDEGVLLTHEVFVEGLQLTRLPRWRRPRL